MVNQVSWFEFKVVGSCTCLLRILQFLSSATGFLVLLTLFRHKNPRIRAQIIHVPLREEISVIFWKLKKNRMRNKITNRFFSKLFEKNFVTHFEKIWGKLLFYFAGNITVAGSKDIYIYILYIYIYIYMYISKVKWKIWLFLIKQQHRFIWGARETQPHPSTAGSALTLWCQLLLIILEKYT